MAEDAWGELRTKQISWYDPMISASSGMELSGLEFLEAIRDGKIPPPPISRLMGMSLVDIKLGSVVFECEPGESVYNPIGVVHGGLVCTLADSVIGCAVHTTLSPGIFYTSIDLNVSYLRPVTADSGVLRATGTVTKPGRRVAFATSEIVDGYGKVVATASSSCLVMSRPGAVESA